MQSLWQVTKICAVLILVGLFSAFADAARAQGLNPKCAQPPDTINVFL